MEILEDKYIPEDDIKNIAYQIKPEFIFNFCRINKITNSICRNRIFWSSYINDDQQKYNQLLLSAAEQDNEALFERIWHLKTNNLLYEGKISEKCLRVAILNGNDNIVKFLWRPLQYIDLENFKAVTILNEVINTGDFEQCYQMLQHFYSGFADAKSNRQWLNIKWKVFDALANSPNYNFLVKLLKSINEYYIQALQHIFSAACNIGNINIAKGIINGGIRMSEQIIIWDLLSSPSDEALELLLELYPNYAVSRVTLFGIYNNSIVIRNKNILYDLMRRINKNHREYIFINSPLVFKPYEFIRLLNHKRLCYEPYILENVINILEEEGEDYFVKILGDEAPLCEPVNE